MLSDCSLFLRVHGFLLQVFYYKSAMLSDCFLFLRVHGFLLLCVAVVCCFFLLQMTVEVRDSGPVCVTHTITPQ